MQIFERPEEALQVPEGARDRVEPCLRAFDEAGGKGLRQLHRQQVALEAHEVRVEFGRVHLAVHA